MRRPIAPLSTTAIKTRTANMTATNPSKHFTDLPGEFRNEIYSYITPINGHMRDFEGFVFSCKQVYIELTSIAPRAYVEYLEKIQSEARKPGNYPDVTIDIPTSLSDVHKIKISYAMSALRKSTRIERSSLLPDQIEPFFFNPLDKLLGLHLSKLVIGLRPDMYDDWTHVPASVRDTDFPSSIFGHFGSVLSENSINHLTAVRKISWDVPFSRHRATKQWQQSIFHALINEVGKPQNAAWNCFVTGLRVVNTPHGPMFHGHPRSPIEDGLVGVLLTQGDTRPDTTVGITNITWEKK